MRKLNKRKILWIIREVDKGELSIRKIAKIQNISERWVREIYRRFKGKDLRDPNLEVFKKPGRKPKPITEEEINLINEIHQEFPMGAVSIERLLKNYQYEMQLSHNRIHRILLMLGLSKRNPKKSKRRKWIRYERRYSNSLWHVDWMEFKGEKVIAYEDDASRFIVGFGVFRNATAKHSVEVLRKAVEEWGKPKEVMSDHGPQFTSIEREGYKKPKPNEFQRFLKENGIRHVKARVKHPQSNGKIERLFLSLKKYRDHFGSWEKAVEFYNFRRPHMSLEANGILLTPYQAFIEKLRR